VNLTTRSVPYEIMTERLGQFLAAQNQCYYWKEGVYSKEISAAHKADYEREAARLIGIHGYIASMFKGDDPYA
jgi:hypothetical protein